MICGKHHFRDCTYKQVHVLVSIRINNYTVQVYTLYSVRVKIKMSRIGALYSPATPQLQYGRRVEAN